MDKQLEYLKKIKFDRQLKKLNKKLKGKKIIIYGAGLLFKKIKDNYDLSGLNITGISDKKYSGDSDKTTDFGYKTIPLNKIKEAKPDVILISTLKYLKTLREFRENMFSHTGIKIYPLADKPFFELLKEVFEY